MSEPTLYQRLGGYDAIAAVCADLIARLRADAQLGRFWAYRGEDGIKREYQLLVDYLCNATGGPMYYTGRDNQLSHRGMGINASDWDVFMGHLRETLNKWLRGRIAALRGARSLAYLLDMSRSLRSVRLALHPARRFLQRFLRSTLNKFAVPERERGEVLAFIESTRADIVEC